jgi:hypothetical protein
MPLIPDTQEAEIERITVSGHPEQKIYETSSQPINQAWWCEPVIRVMREA